jgi:hypothetical protein
MTFLAQRLSGDDYTRFRVLLHASVNPMVAARLHEANDQRAEAEARADALRDKRKAKK